MCWIWRDRRNIISWPLSIWIPWTVQWQAACLHANKCPLYSRVCIRDNVLTPACAACMQTVQHMLKVGARICSAPADQCVNGGKMEATDVMILFRIKKWCRTSAKSHTPPPIRLKMISKELRELLTAGPCDAEGDGEMMYGLFFLPTVMQSGVNQDIYFREMMKPSM